jgi:catechol 2,3-dioxygenase-like lactoylglutathione lyase family enzyme
MSAGYALDHIALGLHRIADGIPLLAGELGGRFKDGGPSGAFTGAQWVFADGERLELIEPLGEPGGFMHRFLAARGPGVHHVTFKVPDIAAAAERVRRFGYGVVGYNDDSPYWKELFLHPKQALGIVVQLAEEHPLPDGMEPWGAGWEPGPSPARAEPPVRVVGLRLAARDAAAARRQWGELLGGRERTENGRLSFEWPDSPLKLFVRLGAAPTDGPEAIELRCARRLDLTPDDRLGARFEQI